MKNGSEKGKKNEYNFQSILCPKYRKLHKHFTKQNEAAVARGRPTSSRQNVTNRVFPYPVAFSDAAVTDRQYL